MYEFLSAEWVDEVRNIRDRYKDQVDSQVAGLIAKPVAVNLVINQMPNGAPDTLAHSVTTPQGSQLEIGHVAEASVTITLDFDTARSVVIEQNLASIMRAFLMGSLRVEGDLTSLFGDELSEQDPMMLLSALNVAGIQSLGDVDPIAAEIGNAVRAITA